MRFCLRGLLILFAVALGLSGCSIASQRAAVPLPLHLTNSTTTTTPASTPTNEISVYFLRDGLLVAASEYATDPIASALLLLGRGPSQAQLGKGMTTAFEESPAKLSTAGAITPDGTVSVEVDTAFLNLPVIPLEEASAQIVFTLTGIPNGPSSVRFVLDGQALASFVPPGKLVDRAVTRLDYCRFAPLNYSPCHTAAATS